MPGLPCYYIFSTLPQEWKARYSFDQRFNHKFNTAVIKWLIEKNTTKQKEGYKSNPWWSWYSSTSLSLDLRCTFGYRDQTEFFRVLQWLQTKLRNNAAYPHAQTYSELQSPSENKQTNLPELVTWILAEAAKSEPVFVGPCIFHSTMTQERRAKREEKMSQT